MAIGIEALTLLLKVSLLENDFVKIHRYTFL